MPEDEQDPTGLTIQLVRLNDGHLCMSMCWTKRYPDGTIGTRLLRSTPNYDAHCHHNGQRATLLCAAVQALDEELDAIGAHS